MLRAASLPFPIAPGYTGQAQPYILSVCAIPFVGLSSGSVSAVGAITGITALPNAYPRAYCYFPANILATTIAAGWYYCTFSTTTAGTAFLNTYTSGQPTIPSSPTAVTDGKGAFTGDTGEEFGPTISVPAGAMGANGQVLYSVGLGVNSNANAKTGRVRFSTSAGTVVYQANAASNTREAVTGRISNRGVTNVQVGVNEPTSVGDTATNTFIAADTTLATSVVMSVQRATATDNMVIESYRVELLYGA